MSTTVLPNKNFGFPALNDAGWGTTLNASFPNVDSAFGGNQAFAVPSSGTISVSSSTYLGSYPANTASYIPLSWTLTGTVTGPTVTFQLPTGVGGQWIVNNQCSFIPGQMIVSAVGGSTSAQLSSGVQIIYSDGLGHVYQTSTSAVSGLTNAIPVFTTASSIGNSVMRQVGGNIGINTSTPLYQLHVEGTELLGTSSLNSYIALYANSATCTVIESINALNTSKLNLSILPVGGNVGIRTVSPTFPLHVNGTAFATGAAGALSDERHKTNIEPLSYGLDIVMQLKPVSFDWKTPTDDGMQGRQIGFIAQDVEQVLPSAVLTYDHGEDEKGLKGLKQSEFTAVAIKAIQELAERVRQLEAAKP